MTKKKSNSIIKELKEEVEKRKIMIKRYENVLPLMDKMG